MNFTSSLLNLASSKCITSLKPAFEQKPAANIWFLVILLPSLISLVSKSIDNILMLLGLKLSFVKIMNKCPPGKNLIGDLKSWTCIRNFEPHDPYDPCHPYFYPK